MPRATTEQLRARLEAAKELLPHVEKDEERYGMCLVFIKLLEEEIARRENEQ